MQPTLCQEWQHLYMSLETWEHDGEHYCLLPTHVKGDEAWYFELSEACLLYTSDAADE